MNSINNECLASVTGRFKVKGNPISFEECTAGHINRTYFITCMDESGKRRRYVLQMLNTSIFKKPCEVMENIVGVTKHIRNKLRECGGDYERGTLNVIGTTDNMNYYESDSGEFWRMYDFVEGTVCLQTVDSAEMFGKVGYAFGHFQKQLADFDASVLHETIPDFHNTVSRFNNFSIALKSDKAGRAAGVPDDIKFVLDREDKCSYIMDGIASGRLPLRVTHNDTKLNNILIDKTTGEGLCVIDLDTVMPGSVLCDFGDSIRFGASSAAEDETDLDNVYMRLDMFDAYAKGFIGGLDNSLTADEIKAMPMGALMLTLETGIRFLTDYLDGDTYFRIAYPTHNLDRARNQFKLVQDMEVKMPLMDAIIKKYL